MKTDILVLGGGFAGLWAALTAAREIDQHGAGETVTLVSNSPYLTIRPRLYEANPQNLRAQLQPTLEPVGITFVQAEARSVSPEQSSVALNLPDGSTEYMIYQRLILTTGSKMQLPPIPGLEKHSWSIDDHESATAFDAHLTSLKIQPVDTANNTFAIIGAGFTGVELACEMRDRIAVHHGEPAAQQAEIFLFDQSKEPGAGLGTGPSVEIKKALDEARVQFHGNVEITSVSGDGITLGNSERIASRTIIATTGLKANLPVGLETIATDNFGRLITNDNLQLTKHDTIFAAGDTAYARVDDAHHALMSCQHAMPMGRHAGFNAAHDLLGLKMRTYRQPTYQTCLDLGRSGAVLTLGWDRQVKKTGAEAGELKRNINTKWIYPPTGTRKDILQAADIDGPPVR